MEGMKEVRDRKRERGGGRGKEGNVEGKGLWDITVNGRRKRMISKQ